MKQVTIYDSDEEEIEDEFEDDEYDDEYEDDEEREEYWEECNPGVQLKLPWYSVVS